MELRDGRIGTSPVSGQIHRPVCPSQGVWNGLFSSSYAPLCQNAYLGELILMLVVGFERTEVVPTAGGIKEERQDKAGKLSQNALGLEESGCFHKLIGKKFY